MVWVSVGDTGLYPELADVVLKEILKLPKRRPKVFAAFVKWSDLRDREAQARKAFEWGSPPRIRPRPLGDEHFARYVAGNEICVAIKFLDQVQKFISDVKSQRIPTVFGYYSLQDNARLLVESKILHEMVHWAYTSRHGRDQPLGPNRKRLGLANWDQGWDFEVEAYGKPMTAATVGLYDYIQLFKDGLSNAALLRERLGTVLGVTW